MPLRTATTRSATSARGHRRRRRAPQRTLRPMPPQFPRLRPRKAHQRPRSRPNSPTPARCTGCTALAPPPTASSRSRTRDPLASSSWARAAAKFSRCGCHDRLLTPSARHRRRRPRLLPHCVQRGQTVHCGHSSGRHGVPEHARAPRPRGHPPLPPPSFAPSPRADPTSVSPTQTVSSTRSPSRQSRPQTPFACVCQLACSLALARSAVSPMSPPLDAARPLPSAATPRRTGPGRRRRRWRSSRSLGAARRLGTRLGCPSPQGASCRCSGPSHPVPYLRVTQKARLPTRVCVQGHRHSGGSGAVPHSGRRRGTEGRSYSTNAADTERRGGESAC